MGAGVVVGVAGRARWRSAVQGVAGVVVSTGTLHVPRAELATGGGQRTDSKSVSKYAVKELTKSSREIPPRARAALFVLPGGRPGGERRGAHCGVQEGRATAALRLVRPAPGM